MNEEVHFGAWPSFSVYPGAAYALGPEVNTSASQIYAAEGQCFVISPCATVSDEMIERLCDAPHKHEFLKRAADTREFWPDGRPLAEPLDPGAEGIIYADIDLTMISIAKAAADPTGHYSRPDVTRLWLNREPAPRVMEMSSGTARKRMLRHQQCQSKAVGVRERKKRECLTGGSRLTLLRSAPR